MLLPCRQIACMFHVALQGGKKGETWSVDGGGHRYQRWWGEEHFGNGWVRRFGNSTTGTHCAGIKSSNIGVEHSANGHLRRWAPVDAPSPAA